MRALILLRELAAAASLLLLLLSRVCAASSRVGECSRACRCAIGSVTITQTQLTLVQARVGLAHRTAGLADAPLTLVLRVHWNLTGRK